MAEWPRLSETIGRSADLTTCANCGAVAGQGDLQPHEMDRDGPEGESLPIVERWQEHDGEDRPEMITVPLCSDCAEMIVEPHPRLYRLLEVHEPMPGGMGICRGCGWLDREAGLRCTSPDARHNGGEGITIRIRKPSVMHLCYRGKNGGRRGAWIHTYFSPPEACTGRAPRLVPHDPPRIVTPEHGGESGE